MSDLIYTGKPLPWEHDGKKYLFGNCDFDMECDFQIAHVVWARRQIEATRGKISDEAFATDLDAHGKRVAANAFQFGTGLSWQFLWSREGWLTYLDLKLQKGRVQGGEPLPIGQLRVILKDENVYNEVEELVGQHDFPTQIPWVAIIESRTTGGKRKPSGDTGSKVGEPANQSSSPTG